MNGSLIFLPVRELTSRVATFCGRIFRCRRMFFVCLAGCLLCIDTETDFSLHTLTAPLATILLLSLVTVWIPRVARGVVQVLLGCTVLAICLFDCYCQLFLGSQVTPQIMTTILETDAREAGEFFSTFIGLNVFLKWRILLLLLLMVTLPVLYVPAVRRKLMNCWLRVKERWLKGGGNWLNGTMLAVAIFCVVVEVGPTVHFFSIFNPRADQTDTEGAIFGKRHREVSTPLHRTLFAWHTARQSENTFDGFSQLTYDAQIDAVSHRSPHIVFVIGESYNKHHASLYGYALPTTPRQEARRNAGELTVFSDVVSPWNITSSAFLHLFSVNRKGVDKRIGECPLFPVLFRRAGYRVTFFSNQFVLRGLFRGPTNHAGHFFLSSHRLSDTLFDYRNGRKSHFDMGLVWKLAEWREDHPEPPYTLDIVHLMGQHFEYEERYPARERRFGEHDYAGRKLNVQARRTVMDYDNATLYNDQVVDSILSMYEKEEAVVIYLSDHGDEVYDELPVQGRQFREPGWVEARNEFEVPLWIWCSDIYRERHPEVVNSIRAAAYKPMMSDNVSQMLLWLAGIESAWTDETQNPLSPAYRGKARIIAGTVNYDELQRR